MRQHPIWNVAVFGLANGGVVAAVRARGRDVGRPRLFWHYALIAGLLALAAAMILVRRFARALGDGL